MSEILKEGHTLLLNKISLNQKFALNIDDIGDVLIIRNRNAKRFIFRERENQLVMTVPYHTSIHIIERVIAQNKESIRTLLTKKSQQIIDLNYHIDTDFFALELKEGLLNRFLLSEDGNKIQIIVPPNTDFRSPNNQQWLVNVIEQSLRKRAQQILPNKVYGYATSFNLEVNSIKINLSKGRWGSCSSKKNINLSAYLLLLPERLINYVILHELAHLTEMNHSSKFWTLLDNYTDGHAKQLTNELKNYKTSVL